MSMTTTHRLLGTRPRLGVLFDVAVAAAALAGTLALVAHGGVTPSHPGSDGLDPIGVVLAASSTLPLIAWRRFPLGVFVLTAAAGVLLGGLGYPLDLLLGPAAALFMLAASRDQQTPWTGRTTAIVIGLLLAFLGATAAAQGTFPGLELLHTGLAWAVAWFAGERTRLRREHVADLRERALRLERDAERERLLAVAEERLRIARDLHDSAGHAINVIAIRAGAARLRRAQDYDRSFAALEAIEELARQTAEEIDKIVGKLREDEWANEAVAAPAGLASIGTVIADHSAAGLDVTLDTAGSSRPLGGAADQAAYRILQEALTNAARHGAGSARVELTFDDEAVELTVANPVAADVSPRSSGGHGLIGMRERASLVGGSLETERADGTFQVRARIPYGAHRA